MAVMNGVRQWIFQRTTNVFLVIFGLVLLITAFSGISYESLSALLEAGWFKTLALVTLILGCLNSVLAGWQIVGDYAKKFHLPEKLLNIVIVLVTVIFFIMAVGIIF